MLDRAKLLKEIEIFSGSIFFDYSQELELAQKLWEEICHDTKFATLIKDIQIPLIIPTWQDDLNNIITISPKSNYIVVATDGSQIYPDRHQGTSCFLINISSIILDYNDTSSFKFSTTPFLYAWPEDESADIVDCKRQELEFKFGLDTTLELQKENKQAVFFFDGSIIFWNLEAKSPKMREEFLSKYLGLMHQFYKNDLLMAGYISLPKSKELVNLLRVKLSNFHINSSNKNIDFKHIVDSQIANLFLNPMQRSIVFKNHSPITQNYPEHLKPYFFYLNVGQEIVRIEIPGWIAAQEEKIKIISEIIVDQCIKGHGYPICLSEAHEQAVVKGSDRELFYQILNKLSVEHKQHIYASQKSLKKRRMNV